MKKLFILTLSVVLFLNYACKKTDSKGTQNPQPTPNTSVSSIHFSNDSPFYKDVRQYKAAPNSAIMMDTLLKKQLYPHYSGIAAFNGYNYGTPTFIALSSDPRMRIEYVDPSKNYIPSDIYDGEKFFLDVPIPSNLKGAAGSDGAAGIWDPQTDKLWEFWQLRKNSEGKWTARAGGRIDNVSSHPGFFKLYHGVSASGLSFSATSVKIDEIEKGLQMIKEGKVPEDAINHAIYLGILRVRSCKYFSWPANRSDGEPVCTSENYIMEGQRIRLKKDVDVMKLKISDFAKVIAIAAQKYGFIVMDKSGCVAIGGESLEPYNNSKSWKSVMGSYETYNVLKGFPWEQCEVVEANAGKP